MSIILMFHELWRSKSQDSNQEPQMRKREQSPNRELNLHPFTSLMHYARPSRLTAKWNCGTEDVFRMAMHCILLRLQQPLYFILFYFFQHKKHEQVGRQSPWCTFDMHLFTTDPYIPFFVLQLSKVLHWALHLVSCLASFHREYRLWWSGWRKWLGDWQP